MYFYNPMLDTSSIPPAPTDMPILNHGVVYYLRNLKLKNKFYCGSLLVEFRNAVSHFLAIFLYQIIILFYVHCRPLHWLERKRELKAIGRAIFPRFFTSSNFQITVNHMVLLFPIVIFWNSLLVLEYFQVIRIIPYSAVQLFAYESYKVLVGIVAKMFNTISLGCLWL